MNRRLVASLVAGAVLFIGTLSIPASSLEVRATHGPPNPAWVEINAPFSGYFDRFGLAHPSVHDTGAWNGDWETDFYREPSVEGRWYPGASSSGSWIVSRIAVGGARNTCEKSSWTIAGYSYKIDLTDNSGYLGWFGLGHVDPEFVGGGTYFISPGAQVADGMYIGTQKKWDELAGCWAVSTDAGVHWHVDAWNAHNYACYFPHASGTWLSSDFGVLGAVGANAMIARQPCWQ
ncbi:MAG: hypothetical protein ACRDHF_01920 [Tepidiformaceae bacterium]